MEPNELSHRSVYLNKGNFVHQAQRYIWKIQKLLSGAISHFSLHNERSPYILSYSQKNKTGVGWGRGMVKRIIIIIWAYFGPVQPLGHLHLATFIIHSQTPPFSPSHEHSYVCTANLPVECFPHGSEAFTENSNVLLTACGNQVMTPSDDISIPSGVLSPTSSYDIGCFSGSLTGTS